MKLRSKINFYTTVLFIGLLVLINSAVYFSFSHMILKGELEKTTLQAMNIVKGMNRANENITASEVLRAYAPVNSMIRIVKEDNTFESGITAPEQDQLIDLPVVYYGYEQHNVVKHDNTLYAFISIPIIWGPTGEVAEMQLTENYSTTKNILEILKLVLVAVTLLAAIPAFLSSRFLGNFITRPISTMILTMHEIQESGNYKRIELPKQSNDELYQMGKTFNEMMKRLKQNYERQEEFVSNASHELKTPLTVIESYSSLLKRHGKERPEVFDESVEAIHSEAIRMKELTEQLLMLAKQGEKWNVEITKVSLEAVTRESVRSFQTAFKRKINLDIEELVFVQADFQKLKQILYILLDNAFKYSEEEIRVNVTKIDSKGIIEIIDSGIGIPATEISNIFDRFYRVDKARSRVTGGFGLGLPLAMEIADAMGAELNVESTEGRGTKVKIILNVS